jgi:thioesterase domain-containing protein
MQSEGDLPPFFCVPGAGGNVIYLHQLARRLGRNQPFYGLQAVGLDGRIPPHKSVEEMASHNVEVIERAKYGPPYMLGGHSLGGWVAFEMALQLEARGHKVGAVVVLDTPAPEAGMGQDTSAWDQARWIVEFSDRVRHLLRGDLRIDVQVLEDLSPDQQLAYLVTELARIHLLSSAEGLEEVERILQVFMAHSQLSYGPASPVAAPILLLRTESHDPEWPQTIIDDRHWGWDAHGSVTSEIVPGTHLTMLAEPLVEELARRLSTGLAEASVSAPRTASGQLASGGWMT